MSIFKTRFLYKDFPKQVIKDLKDDSVADTLDAKNNYRRGVCDLMVWFGAAGLVASVFVSPFHLVTTAACALVYLRKKQIIDTDKA